VPFDVKLLREEEILRSKRYRVVREQYAFGHGGVTVRDVIRHPGAVVCIPRQSDGRLMLLRQYRYTLRQAILEFPAGTREPGEEWLACARRELAEEVGRAAEEWIPLGILFPAPGICDEVQHCYLAQTLSAVDPARDYDELMEIELFTPREVEKAIADGELCDAKSIAAFMRARLRGLL